MTAKAKHKELKRAVLDIENKREKDRTRVRRRWKEEDNEEDEE